MPGVALVADNPTDHHIFLKGFTGLRDLHSNSLGIKAVTENGDVEIMEAVAFRDRTGVAIKPDGAGMTLNALRSRSPISQPSRHCIARVELRPVASLVAIMAGLWSRPSSPLGQP